MYTLKIEKKTFRNENNEDVEYFHCVAVINGCEISFVPKAEDKKLLKHLLSNKK